MSRASGLVGAIASLVLVLASAFTQMSVGTYDGAQLLYPWARVLLILAALGFLVSAGLLLIPGIRKPTVNGLQPTNGAGIPLTYWSLPALSLFAVVLIVGFGIASGTAIVQAIATVAICWVTWRLDQATRRYAGAAEAQAEQTTELAKASAQQTSLSMELSRTAQEQLAESMKLRMDSLSPFVIPKDPQPHRVNDFPSRILIPSNLGTNQAPGGTSLLSFENIGPGAALNVRFELRQAVGATGEALLPRSETAAGNLAPSGGVGQPSASHAHMVARGYRMAWVVVGSNPQRDYDPTELPEAHHLDIFYDSADGRHFRTAATWGHVAWENVHRDIVT